MAEGVTTLGAAVSRRRALGVSAVGLVGGVALAACGPTDGGAGGTTASQTKGPVSIEVVTRAGVASPSGHSQFYDKQARNIFTPETKTTVTFIDAQPHVGEKLTVMAAGGTLPDASWFGVVADGNAGREQATKGIFKPLDDIIKKDSKFDKAPYLKSLLDVFTLSGKLYALPTHGHYGTNILYYNANMTKAAGVTVPADGNWSVDDFVLAAQKLVKKDQDIWGFFSPWSFSEFGVFYVRQFGGEYIDETGKKLLLDSAEARAGLEWIYNAQAKHELIDKHFRDDNKAANVLFTEGKLGFVSWTPGFVAEWKNPGANQISPANGKFELGVAFFPKGPNNRRGTQASGSGMGLTDTKKQDAAWEWLKFATNKMNGVEQVFGGAGSPGGRVDVWNDSKLLAFDPIYTTISKAFPQGAGSLRYSANFRYADLTTAVNKELEAYFRQQVSVADATSKAVQAGNVLLNQ